jgi:alpha-mannosidase
MDCNVTGGESLVRQVMFGTRFFRDEFGVEPDCLWLPDVFGYSAALPQILQRSGVRRFLTQKISWNDTTSFPHHSFYWEGIDGSRVLSHFLPGNDYNSTIEAPQMIAATRTYRQKDRSPIQAILYGYGDGGGGPTAAHLERRRRYSDLEGMPKMRTMSTQEFFDRLENESTGLPLWVGELYLECHRGTYTTRARNKKQNRQAELALREAEWLMSLATTMGGRYDHRRLAAAWKLVLLNQFHDIIPGSSIDEVYRDSDRDYEQVFATAGELRSRALARVVAQLDTRGEGRPVAIVNSLSWRRTGCVEVEAASVKGPGSLVARSADGTTSPVQLGADGKARFLASAPSLGCSVVHLVKGRAAAPQIKATARLLENDLVRARFDTRGRLTSLYHKGLRREAIAAKSVANQFQLFEDKTVACGPAWDIDIYSQDKLLEADGRLLSAEVIEAGPVRSVVRFRRTISRSTLTQDVVLQAHSTQLDFRTRVEWGDEKDVMLKVAFPLAVRTHEARYEIQFGNLARPTHRNTYQDMARFEVAAHRWADLSEADFGVSLLNDCKYGHDALGNVLRLTLLRASRSPGKTADVFQTHEFTYSLLPHEGDYTHGTVRAGYELNVPLAAADAGAPLAGARAVGSLGVAVSFFDVSGDNVVLETVKQAEDGSGIILRLYEAHGCRGRRTVRTSLPVAAAVETDLMERQERRLAVRDGRIALDFQPFQIRTVKLRLARNRQR